MLVFMLSKQIHTLVQDRDIKEDLVSQYVIEGLSYISSMVLLPKLHRTTILTFTEHTLPLPLDFGRELYHARGEEEYTIYDSYETYKRYKKEPALLLQQDLQIITKEPLPLALECSYYAKPPTEAFTADTSKILPPGFEVNIVTEYALYKVYKWIEDGDEGLISNTSYHYKQFQVLLNEMDRTIGHTQNRPEPQRVSWP